MAASTASNAGSKSEPKPEASLRLARKSEIVWEAIHVSNREHGVRSRLILEQE
jgi:hypothetical protein